ncbi:MAG: hypothetical protein E4H01_11820, partial [Lysobacterales bacterium]
MAQFKHAGEALEKLLQAENDLVTDDFNKLADIDATAAEINAVADMSGQVVAPATGNVTLSAAVHGNRVLYYDDADGVITLPAATGGGYTYTIILKTAFTSGTIVGLTNAATLVGGIHAVDADDNTSKYWT